MGMFRSISPQKETAQKPQQEFRQYISGAGPVSVSKSVLEARTALRWLFQRTTGSETGWVAFGASEYSGIPGSGGKSGDRWDPTLAITAC